MGDSRSLKLIYLLKFMVGTLVLLGLATSAAANDTKDQFPLRAFYPTVAIIDTTTLLQLYDHAIIIDVRSKFEFDVIRINKAVNINIANGDFTHYLDAQRQPVAEVPLIFYCNDPSCSRAFRAALLAQAAGYTNIYTYDSGIFSLLKKAPTKVTLMGTTPAQAHRVIPKETFEKTQLDFEQFKQLSTSRSALVIDIRDIFRRDRSPDMENIRNIPMESLLQGVTSRIWTEKKLLIFDQQGKQTQSLQYFLQANGYSDYAFLRGGVQNLDSSTTISNQGQNDSPVSINQKELVGIITSPCLQAFDIELITLAIAHLRFENHSVIDLHWIQENLKCSTQQLKQAATRLQNCDYLLFDLNQTTLLCHINPRLAWKGKMSGAIWSNSVSEFTTSTTR